MGGAARKEWVELRLLLLISLHTHTQEDRKVMTLPHMADVAQALSHVPSYTKKLQVVRNK